MELKKCTATKVTFNYFTSSHPHHDIYTFCYRQIFWHIFWHFIWQIFWHSIWHIFWHSIYLAYLLAYVVAYLLALYLAYFLVYLLTFYLANLLAFYLANILALYLAYLLAFYLTVYLAYLLAFCLAYLLAFYLAFYLTFYLAFYLAYLLAFYLAVQIQRCPLSSEGPRLRSSGAHWDRKVPVSGAHWALQVPGWGPAVPTALRTWRLRSSRARSDRKPAVEAQQRPLRAEVGEDIGEELARRKWTWKLVQTWSRRNWRRRKRRRRRRRRSRRRMRRTALIKSNNPHLAGGEKTPKNAVSLRTRVPFIKKNGCPRIWKKQVESVYMWHSQCLWLISLAYAIVTSKRAPKFFEWHSRNSWYGMSLSSPSIVKVMNYQEKH